MPLKSILQKHQEKSLILSDQLIVSGVNFLLSILLARQLGMHVFGTFAAIQLIQLFVSSFQQALVIAPLITIVPAIHNQKEKQQVITTLLLFNIAIVGVVFLVAAIVSTGVFRGCVGEHNFPVFAVAVYVSSLISYEFIRKVLLTNKKYYNLVLLNIGAYVFPLLLMGALFLNYTLTLTIVFYILSSCFIVGVIMGSVMLRLSFSIKHITASSVAKTWGFSKWLMGKAIVQWFSGNYFIVVAGLVLGKNTIGVIRIVQNLFGVLNVLLMAVENYLAIKSSAIYSENGIKALGKFQNHVLLRISFVVFVLLVTISIFSKLIIISLYGMEYADHHYLIYWFSVLYFLIFINLPNRFILRTLLKTNSIFYSYVGCTVFSLLLARPLINMYGVSGVAIGLISCQLVMFCWNQYFVFKSMNKIVGKVN